MKNLEGKKVKIYFDDKSSSQKIGFKIGLCVLDNNYKIAIKNNQGYLEVIPYYQIIRVIETGGYNDF